MHPGDTVRHSKTKEEATIEGEDPTSIIVARKGKIEYWAKTMTKLKKCPHKGTKK